MSRCKRKLEAWGSNGGREKPATASLLHLLSVSLRPAAITETSLSSASIRYKSRFALTPVQFLFTPPVVTTPSSPRSRFLSTLASRHNPPPVVY
ncbi:uncharacterized protein EV420DRAFT_1643356 [Desarmillaria tabescens]|uniref:Uncharacterized protein n=1 Tax=Armillaria tabescens TaxID=1929756 RepID=A0AA39KDS2_ARMTA|nr:uncharacterized protein EV420DRAFT_1643356 [Desarmillaria tabescens]KAK0458006.1 hypothetical protein EV420DRAFT_1643356 [Desarmillaria tabescens]